MTNTRAILAGLAVVSLIAFGTAVPAQAQTCDQYDDGSLRPAGDPNPDVACGGSGPLVPPTAPLGTGSLTTSFNSDNQFAGNTFDIVPSADLTIDSFDINLVSTNPAETITIYWRNGTANGNESSAAGWNVLGVDNAVVAAGQDNPTPVAIGGLALTAGMTYGFYVDFTSYNGTGPVLRYTNGGPTTFMNADMDLTTFHGKGNPAFTGGTFFPRQWNGTVYYTLGTDADLSLTKTADPDPVAPGGDLTYTLTVTNNGPDDAANTVVTDTLPVEFSYTGDDCGGGVMGGPPGGTFTWMVGTLNNGANAVCNVTGTIDPGVASGTIITNSATASSDATDPTPGNETAAAASTVQASILEIPTLSTVGLVALLGLLALIAIWRIRRAQHV